MRRIFLAVGIFAAIQTASAQEKGLHLTLGGGLGKTSFAYDLDGGRNRGGVGYGGTLGLQYFFNYHWGISLAGELFVYNTQSVYDQVNSYVKKDEGTYQGKEFVFANIVDNEGGLYDRYNVRLQKWRENQKTLFFELPLMGMYQTKFGKQEKAGLYFGLGVKLQIPVSSTFSRYDGVIQTSGHLIRHQDGDPTNIWFGEPGLSQDFEEHGFGVNDFKREDQRSWSGNSGKNSLKMGFSAVAEFGFLFTLSRRVDLTLGVVADYGFVNISKQNDKLLTLTDATPQDGSYIGSNINYVGVINSEEAPKVNPWSVRGKVGLRIKLGKLKEREEEKEEEEEDKSPSSKRGPDTIFVYPVIVYMQPTDSMIQQAITAGGGNPNGAYFYNPNNGGGNPYGNNPYGNNPYGGNPGGGGPYGRNPYGYMGNGTITEDDRVMLHEPIYFDLDKSFLRQKSVEVLNRKVEYMRQNPHTMITIIGHTCDIGNENHNNALSYNRADAARQYLIQKGIDARRITIMSLGQRNPTHPNDSEENRALNRRVDFLF